MTEPGHIIWIIIVVLGTLVWLTGTILNFRISKIITTFDHKKFPDPATWPKISIIIAACNEAGSIEPALKSKLASDYPDFEIIVVNDRSTDGTDKIIDRMARSDSRIKVIHITDLPGGWLGKPHALSKAIDIATGDYFLFTDADVYFSKFTIKKSVAFCEDGRIDQLGMLPKMISKDPFLKICLLTFIRTYGLIGRFWLIDNPNAEVFSGVGAFNLVRRSAFEKTEGFNWLRMDIADDVALAMMIHRTGGRNYIINGVDEINVEWYTGFREMVIGLEKAAFTTMGNFSLIGNVAKSLLFLVGELWPFIALGFIVIPWLKWMCIISIITGFLNALIVDRWGNGDTWPAFFYPVGSILITAMMIRGGIIGWKNRGVYWRGTFYPVDELKNGKRVRIM